MQRDEVIAILRAHWDDLRRYSVRHLSLFGSVARGDSGPDSDLDLLVEFDGPASFERYTSLLAYLEDLFGRRVDLLTRRSIKPRAAALIDKDLVRVA